MTVSATQSLAPKAAPATGDAEGTTERTGKNPVVAVSELLASFGLAMFTLGGMFLVTLIGTLAQAEIGLHAAIQKYFSSWVFLQQIYGPLRIVLPGGYLLMTLLGLNLLVGGFLRMRWDVRRAGILFTHLGIAMLLIGGAVEALFKTEGAIRLFEGESKAETTAYRDWEVVVFERLDPETGEVREWAFDPGSAPSLAAGRGRAMRLRIPEPDVPEFEVVVSDWLPNAEPRTARNGFDGVILQPLKLDPEVFRNQPGCLVRVETPEGQLAVGPLWGGAFEHPHPFTFEVDGRTFGVSLRRTRVAVPFELRLEDFVRVLHPRTQTPKEYRSDVTLIADDGSEHQQRIQMNDPLRRGGYVIYQESWGQGPNGELFSQFAVAKNPSDRWPILACAIVGLGMVWHFVLLLQRHLGIEARARKVGI